MKNLILGLLAIVFIASSCHETCIELEDCYSIDDALTTEEINTSCIYDNVYRYNDEMYTINICCVCDMLLMAYDCDGNALCDIENTSVLNDCMTEFFENAEYLFSVEVD